MTALLAPAAFLDRDGTLIEERSYLADPAGVRLMPGVIDGLRALRDAGYKLIVVTNQSGIARGLISEAQYERVRRRLDALLALSGITLDGVYHCPHHPAITGPCDCRKPGLALYRRAAADHAIDVQASAFVGDKPGDVEPAAALGGRAILVRTGYGAIGEHSVAPDVMVVDDFAAAVAAILAGGSGTESSAS